MRKTVAPGENSYYVSRGLCGWAVSNRTRAHVLIVEDDPASNAILAFIAADHGKVRVSQAESAREMGAVLSRDEADLIVLDLQLPDGNGLCLARQVRTRSQVPIVVVTGDASSETRLSALEIGVDDFVTKPFDLKEMSLRIRTLLDRSMASRRPEVTEEAVPFARDRYLVNLGDGRLRRATGEPVDLTATESLILAALLERRNSTVSRAALLDAISRGNGARPPRAIDACIRKLRRTIETDPRRPEVIRTVRGVGYKLTG